MSKIVATLDNPHSSAGDLERIIRHDQALTAKLLAVANSAYYGFRHEITTVRRAVVGVGYGEVRNLVMGMSLLGFLHPSTFQNKEIAENLWLHSLAVSECCRILGKETGLFEQESAFTAGLLHDIGKVVLAAFFPEDVEQLKYTIEKEGLSFREGERQLEMEHDRVGGSLADHWELPPMLVEVITRHHSPSPFVSHKTIRADHCSISVCIHTRLMNNSSTAQSLRLGF